MGVYARGAYCISTVKLPCPISRNLQSVRFFRNPESGIHIIGFWLQNDVWNRHNLQRLRFFKVWLKYFICVKIFYLGRYMPSNGVRYLYSIISGRGVLSSRSGIRDGLQASGPSIFQGFGLSSILSSGY